LVADARMLPMSQATLKTERILLVPLSEEHLEHEVELDADPEVMRYLGHGRALARRRRSSTAAGSRQRTRFPVWATGPAS
jgi:RimJ/RimL family protein N-acetyltransferase